MKWIRNTSFSNVFWGLMGLYLLNISVDAPEAEEFIKQNIFNEQESIVEIVVEQMLGYEDAISEHDEKKSEDHNQKKNSKLDIDIQYFSNAFFHSNFTFKITNHFSNFSYRLSSGFHKQITPPPKA